MDRDLVTRLFECRQPHRRRRGDLGGRAWQRQPASWWPGTRCTSRAAPTLRGYPPSAVARVRLAGTLLEGELPPAEGAVVAMRTAVYEEPSGCGGALSICTRPVRPSAEGPTTTATNAIVAFRRFNGTSPHDTSRRPQPLSLANYLPAVHAEVTSRLRALQVGRAISPDATT